MSDIYNSFSIHSMQVCTLTSRPTKNGEKSAPVESRDIFFRAGAWRLYREDKILPLKKYLLPRQLAVFDG